MFITQRVFDPELVGCAVYISGAGYNRTYLVKEAKGQTLSLTSCNGKFDYVNIKDFNGNLKMEILERPQAIPERAPKQPEQMEMVQVIQDIPRNKRTMAQGRVIRTDEQIKAEEKAVETILQVKEGKAIRLEKIIQAMRILNYNWSNKNASSFMRSAIKHGAKIKKVGYGIYAFADEVQA